MKRSPPIQRELLAIGAFLGVGAILVLLFTLQGRDRIERPSSIEIAVNTEINNNPSSDTKDTVQVSSTQTLLSELDTISGLRSKFERTAALYKLVSSNNPTNIEQLLSRSTDLRWTAPKEFRSELQTVLLERLSISNPKVAIEFVLDREQDNSDRNATLVWLFESWATANLATAVAEAKKLPKPNRKFAFEGILQVHAQEPSDQLNQPTNDFNVDKAFVKSLLDALDFENLHDPNLVWSAVIDIAEQDLFFVPQLEELAKQWYRSSGFEVIENIRNSLSHYELKVKLIPNLLRFISTSEPDRAFNYIATELNLELRWDSAPNVIREWANQDPSTAHSAVNNIEPTALRELLQKIALETWALKNPESVLQNLSNFHLQTRSHAVVSAIESLTSKSPELAASWVLQLEHETDQINAARTLVSNWSQNDLEATRDWIQTESAIADFRDALYQTLAISMVSIDPSGAFELALALPIASGGVGLEADVVSKVAIDDVELALTLLPKVRNGQTKAFVYEKVGDALVRNGEFEKAANLGTKLDESNHHNYYQYISYIWVNTDPDKLYEMLPVLPNEEARSKAAYALCVLYDGNDSIPKRQVESLDQYLTENDREILGSIAPFKNP